MQRTGFKGQRALARLGRRSREELNYPYLNQSRVIGKFVCCTIITFIPRCSFISKCYSDLFTLDFLQFCACIRLVIVLVSDSLSIFVIYFRLLLVRDDLNISIVALYLAARAVEQRQMRVKVNAEWSLVSLIRMTQGNLLL